MQMVRSLFVVLLACLPLAAPVLQAQTVRGTVVREIDRSAIRGAVVLLLDESSAVRARTLSTVQGVFVLRAPSAGTYRIQTLRIGFRPHTTQLFELARDTSMALSLNQVPVNLPAVTAQEVAGCFENPREGLATSLLWDEAKTAIIAADITIQELNYRFDVMLHSRKYDTREPRELLESLFLRERHQGSRPWSSYPPDTLELRGYVTPSDSGLRYVAPDLDVLLSPYFTRTHCFRVRDPEQTAPQRLALEFWPLGSIRRSEIKGVLYFDRATRALQSVTFDYVNLPATVRTNVAGGEIEFAQLPNGAWILPRWLIRAPVPVRGQLADTVRRAGSAVNVWSYLPTAIPQTDRLRVTGGDLLAVSAGTGDAETPLWTRPLSSLSVVVVEGDSGDTELRPVAGATVAFAGSPLQEVTDMQGRVAFRGMVEGEYVVEATTPLYAALGLRPERIRVRFPATMAQLDTTMRVKTLPELVRQACGLDTKGAALIGTVIRSDGSPVMRAPVKIDPAAAKRPEADTLGSAETRTGGDGRYAVCNMPKGTDYVITVVTPDGTTVRRPVHIEDAEPVTFMDIVIPSPEVIEP